MNNYSKDINEMCANLGKDRLLVQGAGGNVSWKESDTLWVKGSGTWLAHAEDEEIFVPVDFIHLQKELSQHNFDIKPVITTGLATSNLRPSIETCLHALMPQKIVVHLHAIEALSNLVKKNCKVILQEIIQTSEVGSRINYIFVDYCKPGPLLAKSIQLKLESNKNTNVVFLKNHGVVIGANCTKEIYELLELINSTLKSRLPFSNMANQFIPLASESPSYVPFPDAQIQSLAFNPELYKRLDSDWGLYPDHVVFLGPKAFTYSSWTDFFSNNLNNFPDLIFIRNAGVFISPEFSAAKTAQLIGYFDVISRVFPDDILDPLDSNSIHELINWDAERYRMLLAK